MDFWFKLDDKIRYLFVGGFNFLVAYSIYSGICFWGGESLYQISLALSWVLSSVISFTTQKFFVFKGGKNWIQEYLKCCATWVISYAINAILLEFFVKFVHFNVYISQFVATFIAAVFTYIVFKKFAFKS